MWLFSKYTAQTSLTLKGPEVAGTPLAGQPTDAQIDQLRALPHLKYVSLGGLHSRSLVKLLRLPHALRWTILHDCDIDAASAKSLRHLPGLLGFYTWRCQDVSFLPALSQLQTVQLQITDQPWAVTGGAVVKAISGCRGPIVLILTAPVTSTHLTALLPQLTRLHTLVLVSSSELESLQFLSDVPALQHTLRFLFLSGQSALHSAEMRHILGLKNLTALDLMSSFSEPLDGLTQHLLKPRTLLPNIREFEYER